jgi:tetratricopeptide (TPR) repeat protein
MTTQETTTDGSFKTGGSGKYGQPAPASPPIEVAAKPRLKKKTDATPAPKSQLKYAILKERLGDHDEARRSYEKVLASDARSVDAIIGLARLDQLAGRTADAEAGLQKAIRIEPRSGRTLDALGQFYVGQKRWDEAVAALQSATAAAPEEKEFRFHYAIALAKSGQIEQAVPHLIDTVGSAAAHYNIGLVLHERGELAASEEHFAAALLENPRLQQAQYWLTEVQHEREVALVASNNRAPASPTAEAIVAQRGARQRNPALDHGALRQAVQSGQSRQASAESAAIDESAQQPPAIPTVPPASSPPGAQNLTAEQLEQWNNQR